VPPAKVQNVVHTPGVQQIVAAGAKRSPLYSMENVPSNCSQIRAMLLFIRAGHHKKRAPICTRRG